MKDKREENYVVSLNPGLFGPETVVEKKKKKKGEGVARSRCVRESRGQRRSFWPEAAGVDGIVGRGDEWRAERGVLDVELIHQSTAFGDSCDTRDTQTDVCMHVCPSLAIRRRSMPRGTRFTADFVAMMHANANVPDRSGSIDSCQSRFMIRMSAYLCVRSLYG